MSGDLAGNWPSDKRQTIAWSISLLIAAALHIAFLIRWGESRIEAPASAPAPIAMTDMTLAAAPSPAEAAKPVAPPPVALEKPKPTPLPRDDRGDIAAPKPQRHVFHQRPPHKTAPKTQTTDTAPAPAAPSAPIMANRSMAPAHPATAGSVGSSSARPTWESQIVARIAHFKHYPPEAMRRGWQGTAVLRFVVHRDGSVTSIGIARSSGHESLDEAAEESLREASPLPAPPTSVSGSQFALAAPLAFSLRAP